MNPIVSSTEMLLVLFSSPALIDGLLMTEIKTSGEQIERTFFGYRCVGCDKIYLVHHRIQNSWDLREIENHQCDPSNLRRSVRNARHLGLEKGEHLMEGIGGRWWPERHEGHFKGIENDHVFSREEVDKFCHFGVIDRSKAHELLDMRYEARDRTWK